MGDSSSWRVAEAAPGVAAAIARTYKVPRLVAEVLAARGWEPGAALAAFLSPRVEHGPDPLGLVDVEKAAARLWQAIDAHERIVICGDYDVDGVTSTALLVGFLRAAGAEVGWYLPDRHHDGYGLNVPAIERMAAEGARVIVTVDNGITSLAELAHARSLGIDAILTDHHLPGPELPVTFATVNPQLMADPGPFAPLAGVGVAYTLAAGIVALRPDHPGLKAALDGVLDLVALGTIGDLASLVGENRRLVRAGLQRLARGPRVGVAALARSVKISFSGGGVAETIAHRLLPRLNAAGRMAKPDFALELLLEDDTRAARTQAERLGELNQQRRTLTEATEAQAMARLREQPPGPVIALADERWHHGVAGIVAARLAERFERPAILFARDGEGWRGSGRSVPTFDLHAALDELSGFLGRHGGHAQAVGLTVTDERFEAFTSALAPVVERRRAEGPAPQEALGIDLAVPLTALTATEVEGLGLLEPTGMGNPPVVLLARNVKIVRQERRGPQGHHLWLQLADGDGPLYEAIGFGLGSRHPLGATADLAFTPGIDRWQGKSRLQLRLVDVL